jgi:hypothetical protein
MNKDNARMAITAPNLLLRPLLMLVAVLVALAGGTARAQDLPPRGTIDSITPDLIRAETTTDVTLRLRNQSYATEFRLVVLSVDPPTWTATLSDTSFSFIGANGTRNYTLRVAPGFFDGNGTVRVRIDARDLFGDIVTNVATQNIVIRARPIPGPFRITDPPNGATLNGAFTIIWQPAEFADDYVVSVHRLVMDQIENPPALIFTTTSTFVNANTATLLKGDQYQINIGARNTVGQRLNTNVPYRFVVEPPAPLGAFALESPTANAMLTTRPTLRWGASANAVSYTVNVLPDVNGLPDGSNPVLVRTGVTGTSLAWDIAPLVPGRRYYASVVAVGERGETRLNNEGLVPFGVAALSGTFNLRAPAANAVDVPWGAVQFSWDALSGAESYSFGLFVERAEGGFDKWIETRISAPVGLPVVTFTANNRPLLWGRRYVWYVEAHAGSETQSPVEPSRFLTTNNMAPFDLLAPVGDRKDIEPRPQFSWRATGTASEVVYRVRVAPRNNDGTPRLPDQVMSPSLSGTSYTFNTDFTRGQRYLWRVTAINTRTGYEISNRYGWQPFAVNPLGTFNLVSPANGQDNVQTGPQLSWQNLAEATAGYRVYLSIPGAISLPPITVPAGISTIDLLDYGVELNGLTTYAWSVEALAPGATRLAANGPYLMTTRARTRIDSCDLIDHLLGRQRFSTSDMATAGIFGAPFDIAYYYRYLADPEQQPCTRQPAP